MKMLKRNFAIVICMTLLFLSMPVSNAATTNAAQPEMAFTGKGLEFVDRELLEAMVSSEDVIPGKLIIKYSANNALTLNKSLKSMDVVQSFQTTDTGDVIEVDLIQSANLADTMQIFSDMPEVEYVEPLYEYRIFEEAAQTVSEAVYWPNDTYVQKKWQWGLQAINIPDTWGRVSEEQRSSQIIAIIDSGVDLDHPDLMDNLVAGYDFVNKDAIPDDDNSHGTHVAGIAAGISGNGMGIAGVASGAKIMPVKVMNSKGTGTSLDIYLGIIFAVRQGADVINLSLGSASPSLLIKEAIEFALQNDVVVVAATGNNSLDAVNYPAAFDGVIAVGAVDWSYDTGFTRASFSNYGEHIDLVAPGVDIFSTIPLEKDLYDGNQDGYALKDGTSMAAPFVSGMAALLKAEDSSLTYHQVQQRLFEDAVDIGSPGWDDKFGMGIINGSNTKAIPEIIEFPHIQIETSGNRVDEFTLSVSAYKGKGVIDAVYFNDIPVVITQTFSNAISGYQYYKKDYFWGFFNMEKNEASLQQTIPLGTLFFDLENGTCTKELNLVDTGYYAFSFADGVQFEDYLLYTDNSLHYIKGNDAEISGTITLAEPSSKNMAVFIYAINEIYSEVLGLGWEYPPYVIIPAGEQSVSYSLNLPPDRNYKLYYAIMTDNDNYQYFGFYKNTGTTLNPNDYTPINLLTGDKSGVSLTIAKTTDRADDVSDTKADAFVLPVNGIAPGNIRGGYFSLEYKGDRDYYTFDLLNAGYYSFYFISNYDLRGTLYDSLGNVVITGISSLSYELDPGTYYLKVEGETGLDTGLYLLAFGPSTQSQIIQFTDDDLRKAICSYLGKNPTDPIYDTDVMYIQQLNLNGKGISSIGGLEHFISLISLELKGNEISDITPLQSLTELATLDLSNNVISDISPLCYLTSLEELDVSHNNITVIPNNFSNLSNLYLLDLGNNAITSVSPLASMAYLEGLYLNVNRISDIRPLSNMDLLILYLAGNPITDYSPIRNYYNTLIDKDFSVLPVASNVRIAGDTTPGSILTGVYSYSSMIGFPESGTTFRWLRSSSLNGDFVAIEGANAITYTVTESDLNMYLKFEVTPRSTGEPQAGLSVASPACGPISSGSVTPQNPDNGGSQGGGSGGGVQTPPPTTTPKPTASPTPTPTVQPVAAPTPIWFNHVEEDENGRSRIIFDVQEQGINFDEPPVIDATSENGADVYNVNVPASIFIGSEEHEQPVTIRSDAFEFEIQPGTFNVSEGTGTVSLSADISSFLDLPDTMLPDDADSASFIFDFNVYIDGNPVTTFNKPITITVKLDLSGISNLDKVGIWYFSETENKWIYVGGKVNEDGTITFTIPHFTKFAAFEYTGTFTDIKGHWAKEDIEIMASRQVTNGTGNGRFTPDANISRAEFTAMIVRASGITTIPDTNPFRDVQDGDWFRDVVLTANAAGLIQGDANGKFNPAGMITREEMAAIAVRAYCYITGVDEAEIITTQEVRFTDEDKASSWARRYVVLADALDLMSGLPDGTFRPKSLATRAEAIVVIKRLMKGTGIF